AANVDQAGGNAQTLANLLKQLSGGSTTKPGKKPPKRASLQDGVVLWLETSGAVTKLWTQKKVAALAMVPDGTGAIVGTYPSGRLIRVEPDHAPMLLADLPEAEASVLLAEKGRLAAVVTSNPAVLQRRRDIAPEGTWTSKPIDGGTIARWGRLEVVGSGVSALGFRSGETEKPDDSWSEWAGATGFDGHRGTAGAQARFLQLRVTLEGREEALRAVAVILEAPNRAPTIETLTVKRPAKKGEDGLPIATPIQEIAWKAADADGDRLRVRLEAQRDGSPTWIALVEDKILTKPKFTWNTAGVVDGRWRLRLWVSDEPDNPPQRARTAKFVTAPLRIDNTPPQVTVEARPATDGLLVKARAKDPAGGRVAAVRVSVDGGPWRVMGARDGILDESDEAVEAVLPSPGKGLHDVVVQARDEMGNPGAGATQVMVR
ncbi:MAG: hypothetical protein ACC662_11520, partial [Planctomycetota bacterium]